MTNQRFHGEATLEYCGTVEMLVCVEHEHMHARARQRVMPGPPHA